MTEDAGRGDEDLTDADERLMAVLRRLVATTDAVPPRVAAAARAAYSWRTLGAALAELAYDSAVDERALDGVRGIAGEGRFLSFEAPGVRVEMEAISFGSHRRVRGEVAPPHPGPVEFRQPRRSVTRVADGMGQFLVDDLGAGPLSLRWPGHLDDADVVTDWVLL
jgi:hypothetical protein